MGVVGWAWLGGSSLLGVVGWEWLGAGGSYCLCFFWDWFVGAGLFGIGLLGVVRAESLLFVDCGLLREALLVAVMFLVLGGFGSVIVWDTAPRTSPATGGVGVAGGDGLRPHSVTAPHTTGCGCVPHVLWRAHWSHGASLLPLLLVVVCLSFPS